MVSISKILVSLFAIYDVSIGDADIPGMNRRLLHIHPPPTAMPTPGPIPSFAPTDNPVSPAPIEHVVIITNTVPAPNSPAPSEPVVVGPAPTAPLKPDLLTTATLSVPATSQGAQPSVPVPATTVPVVPIPTDVALPIPTKPIDGNNQPTWPLGIATPQPSGPSGTRCTFLYDPKRWEICKFLQHQNGWILNILYAENVSNLFSI